MTPNHTRYRIVAAEIWHQRTCMQDLYAKPPEETGSFLKENDEVFQCMLKYIQTNVINYKAYQQRETFTKRSKTRVK